MATFLIVVQRRNWDEAKIVERNVDEADLAAREADHAARHEPCRTFYLPEAADATTITDNNPHAGSY